MPWDPKPAPPALPQQQQQQPQQPQQPPVSNAAPAPLSTVVNGLPQHPYQYDPQVQAANGSRIKTEPGTEPSYNGLPNTYPSNTALAQGGGARAQQLLQQQYGQAASASVNAMQRGGLALPGQQPRPQNLQLPAQNHQQLQAQYAAAQQQQQARYQQQQLQQPQGQNRVKMENVSPKIDQSSFPPSQPNGATHSQTDGADDGLHEWQTMLTQRRALSHAQHDHLMRMQIQEMISEFDNGLMLPLGEGPQRSKGKQYVNSRRSAPVRTTEGSVAQLDGDVDDDEKPDVKDEDDENAINSDLDDSDDENQENMGEDDDEMGDSILCTYDKVQRVKNKWKCILKDGVMSVKGKEWVFHKGTGEFEWESTIVCMLNEAASSTAVACTLMVAVSD
nr:transcription initiation factor iia large subunit [Quercus suber]